MATLSEFLTTHKPTQCNVGRDSGGSAGVSYDNSGVVMTGGDWPSAVRDIYAWVAEVYKQQTAGVCNNQKCPRGSMIEFKNKETNLKLLPQETATQGVPIDCSGAAWQAIRSYWYRMKLNNSPGFNEDTYKNIITKVSCIGTDGFSGKTCANGQLVTYNSGWEMLQKLGFEILDFNSNTIQPWDIIAMPRTCGGYGHVNIVGEKNSDGTWTIYNATTNHTPTHEVIHTNKNPHLDFANGQHRISTIIRLKR